MLKAFGDDKGAADDVNLGNLPLPTNDAEAVKFATAMGRLLNRIGDGDVSPPFLLLILPLPITPHLTQPLHSCFGLVECKSLISSSH